MTGKQLTQLAYERLADAAEELSQEISDRDVHAILRRLNEMKREVEKLLVERAKARIVEESESAPRWVNYGGG